MPLLGFETSHSVLWQTLLYCSDVSCNTRLSKPSSAVSLQVEDPLVFCCQSRDDCFELASLALGGVAHAGLLLQDWTQRIRIHCDVGREC